MKVFDSVELANIRCCSSSSGSSSSGWEGSGLRCGGGRGSHDVCGFIDVGKQRKIQY